MENNSYSVKEFIEEKFGEIKEHLFRIEAQCLKTNGRVTSLENDRAKIWGAMAVLTLLGGAIITLAIQAIDSKIKNGISETLSNYEIETITPKN